MTKNQSVTMRKSDQYLRGCMPMPPRSKEKRLEESMSVERKSKRQAIAKVHFARNFDSSSKEREGHVRMPTTSYLEAKCL